MRLFFDANVILDVLTDREPWVQDSAAVLSLLDEPNVEGLVAAHSVTTLFYLASKYLGRPRTVTVLLDLLDHVAVTPLDQDLLLRALSLGWKDVEDSVQGISAQRARADYLVTRNPSDFPSSVVPVVTPKQLLAILSAQKE
ncbi:MAG: PIN domain-containing protein [Longimicrobiales bacterium]|nr:PIN domain-containing protein [Longimicrobiales bacterium]